MLTSAPRKELTRVRIWRGRRRQGDGKAAQADAHDQAGDPFTAELTVHHWRAHHDVMASIRFTTIARRFPGLVAQAVKLGFQASRRDTIATIVLNMTSGIFAGYALFATTGVLRALFAEGPTPGRVRAALPSLALVAGATAARSGLQVAANWAESRLGPLVQRVVELRLLELATQVELSAFDDSAFHDSMQRARTVGMSSADDVVSTVIDCLTAASGIVSAVAVVGLLHPILLVLLVVAELPGGWAAIRAARIRYTTNFALTDSYRRKWILTDLMARRSNAAELRSFTLRQFLLARATRLLVHVQAAQLRSARQQTVTRVTANAAGGVATAGVYVALGLLLASGALRLAVAGTAVLAIRSAQSSLASMLFSVNRAYEAGLYFTDYLDFCTDARTRIAGPGAGPAPDGFERIRVDEVSFSYPGADQPALRGVSVEISRGEVVALVGENGSGKTTLAKILAGLYRPGSGSVWWDQTDITAVAPESLRERIAVIAQDHANWPLTARDNITMGRDLDPELLRHAVAAAEADAVVADLPRGYDTLLDRQFKDGAELSGGQWQRIAVARGFYRTAPLLIMDEPTAALDARAEYALFETVRRNAEHRTVLIITHRLASVRHADRIYVLHEGRVAEQGTHSELLALGGQYADLYSLQASQYEMAGLAQVPRQRAAGDDVLA